MPWCGQFYALGWHILRIEDFIEYLSTKQAELSQKMHWVSWILGEPVRMNSFCAWYIESQTTILSQQMEQLTLSISVIFYGFDFYNCAL